LNFKLKDEFMGTCGNDGAFGNLIFLDSQEFSDFQENLLGQKLNPSARNVPEKIIPFLKR
jgi:hypothetical protein